MTLSSALIIFNHNISFKGFVMLSMIRKMVFGSKWILLPFYLGLIVAQVMYAIKFGITLFYTCRDFMHYDESQMMLAVLMLIDITMIANLCKTIISGSYKCFVDKKSIEDTEHITGNLLKIKMSMSLIGISSIHLLQVFINSANISNREIIVKSAVHIVFLVSTVALAYVEYLHNLTEKDEK